MNERPLIPRDANKDPRRMATGRTNERLVVAAWKALSKRGAALPLVCAAGHRLSRRRATLPVGTGNAQ